MSNKKTMSNKKKGNDNQFRDFLRRNGLIILLIIISITLIITLLIIKKNKVLFEKSKIESSKVEIVKNNLLEIKNKNLQKKEENNVKNYSCNDLLESGKKDNGIYEIILRKINEKIKVYCDMKTAGGGWTLILTSKEGGWKKEEVKSNNLEFPSISNNYSILSKADLIKTVVDGKIKYRIDAKDFGKNGGVWEAPENYSFISNSKENTDIKLIKQFGDWKYYTFGIEERMPYICDSEFALLTTSVRCYAKWFGTLVSANDNFSPAPWIHDLEKNPGIIWYWVK